MHFYAFDKLAESFAADAALGILAFSSFLTTPAASIFVLLISAKLLHLSIFHVSFCSIHDIHSHPEGFHGDECDNTTC
jgi:hypothetical protein